MAFTFSQYTKKYHRKQKRKGKKQKRQGKKQKRQGTIAIEELRKLAKKNQFFEVNSLWDWIVDKWGERIGQIIHSNYEKGLTVVHIPCDFDPDQPTTKQLPFQFAHASDRESIIELYEITGMPQEQQSFCDNWLDSNQTKSEILFLLIYEPFKGYGCMRVGNFQSRLANE